MRRTSSRGISLVETVVALAVVSVIAGALLAAGPLQIRGTAAAFRTSAALRLAEGELERARGAAGSLVPGETRRPLESDSLAEPVALRTVSERRPGLLEVRSVVTWEEPGGRSVSVSVASLVAQGVHR